MLDLIETFIKQSRLHASNGFHPLLFSLFEPLLDAVNSNKASKGTTSSGIAALHKQLCDRLTGVFKNKLCKQGTVVSDPAEVQAAKDLAGRLVERAKKTSARDLLVLVSAGVHACVRLASAAPDTEPVKAKKSKKSKTSEEVPPTLGSFSSVII